MSQCPLLATGSAQSHALLNGPPAAPSKARSSGLKVKGKSVKAALNTTSLLPRFLEESDCHKSKDVLPQEDIMNLLEADQLKLMSGRYLKLIIGRYSSRRIPV